jgi:hypothetical protein
VGEVILPNQSRAARLETQLALDTLVDFDVKGLSWRGLLFRQLSTEGWYEYKTERIGQLEVDNAGRAVVRLYPTAELDHYLMYLNKVELIPVR